ncbi:MAG: WbqC family protein [Flavipsychrobacter sp.]|jgi:hypothetical protein|nr:WbqC family protein [Flavipsychrobacter sp.]
MKLGVMQPYIFPYIGYFQLINAVDRFVVYDDVTFIKGGWINRNKILLNGAAHVFTVPLKNASSFVTIGNTEINHALYDSWKNKFMKTLEQAYRKAPYYETGYKLVSGVLNSKSNTIGELAAKSIIDTCSYIGVKTDFVTTATHYGNSELKAKDRVIDICKKEGADTYLNATGGKELYDKDDFRNNGLELKFIKTHGISYPQLGNEFVPWLSIIDVMMFNSPEAIQGFLKECSFE